MDIYVHKDRIDQIKLYVLEIAIAKAVFKMHVQLELILIHRVLLLLENV